MILLFFVVAANIEVSNVNMIKLADHDLFASSNHFSSEIAFDIANDDVMCIIDVRERQLVFMDQKTQTVIRRVGSKGQGPGEFQNPSSIRWIAEEQAFAVMDHDSLRVSKWNLEGKLLGEYRVKGRPYQASFLDKDILLYVHNVRGTRNDNPSVIKFDLKTQKSTVHYDYPAPEVHKFNRMVSNGRKTGFITLEWDSAFLYVLGSDFIATTFSDTGKIQIVDFEGNKVGSSFKVEVPQFPIEDEQIEVYLQEELPQVVRDIIKPNLVHPEFWPTIYAMRIDPNDRLWVFGWSKNNANTHPYSVYDKKGNKLGQGQLPSIPKVITKDALFYLEEDEEGDMNLVKASFKL